MKVTLVSSSSGSRGGGEFYLVGLGKGLVDLGHSVEVVVSEHSGMDGMVELCHASQLPVQRIQYVNTYHRRLRSLQAVTDRRGIRRLSDFLSRLDTDVIHLNHQNTEDGLDLAIAGNDCRRPCVSTVHVTRSMAALKAAGGRFRDAIARRIWRRTGIPVIGISDVSAIDFSKYVGVGSLSSPGGDAGAGQRVYSVANGVTLPGQHDAEALRREWGVRKNDIVLGCIARLEEQKNPLFITTLLPRLPDHVKIVWVGDGRLRQQLESSLSQSGLESRVVLDGWQADASARLAGFDIFILPSLYEGLPLAMLEAMAAGLPCVVSNVDGTRDAIRDGETGYLCPVNDTNAWTSSLMSLIGDEEARKRVGNCARTTHQDSFSVEAMAKGTVAVYEDVIRKFS